MVARLVTAVRREPLRSLRLFFLVMFLLSTLPSLVRVVTSHLSTTAIATSTAVIVCMVVLRIVEVRRGRPVSYLTDAAELIGLFLVYAQIRDIDVVAPIMFPAVMFRAATRTLPRLLPFVVGLVAVWITADATVPGINPDPGVILSLPFMGMAIFGMQHMLLKLQEHQREQNALLGEVLNRLPFPVVVTGTDGGVVLANPAAAALTGAERLDDALRTAGADEITLTRPDGSDARVRVEPVPIEQGTVYALLDVTAQREYEAHLHHTAFHDTLTGLPNRALLWQRFAEAGESYAVLLVDLDGFKHVNDTLGHAAGDDLLIRVADRLRHTCGPEATVARLGGDEFVVLTTADPAPMAAAIRASFELPFRTGAGLIHAGGTVGWAVHEPGRCADEVLALADQAMYQGKARIGVRAGSR
ncbi:diguanylate cyclase domain-containing protein [Jidongwangia harbinensis]|uniref:diguanylate cyclase domain-containing protein n=1 Tax=Jidongwangia harbinensis TaxID=2878561 RepID=UPI001CD99AA7|nr:diguanylate cyclase [Jidongwangia harbinensis]MCA2218386.1 diguanylate cyclase [Jidongwangia harbinensis]